VVYFDGFHKLLFVMHLETVTNWNWLGSGISRSEV